MYLLLGLVASFAQTGQPLVDSVRACDRIEIGQTVSVRSIEGIEGFRIASVRVERSIWAAECIDQFDVLVPAKPPLAVGGIAVWLLASAAFGSDEFDNGARLQLYNIRRAHGLERSVARFGIEPTAGGDRVVLTGRRMAAEQAEIELWNAIMASTPRIECSSSGLEIESDGRGTFRRHGGNEHVLLSAAVMRSLSGVIEREEFYGLPPRIGSSPGPDSTGWEITVRTWRGHHSVLVAGPPDPRSQTEMDAYARALRIRDALPQPIRGRVREE